MSFNVGSKSFWIGYIHTLKDHAHQELAYLTPATQTQPQEQSFFGSNNDDDHDYYNQRSYSQCTESPSRTQSNDEDEDNSAAIALVIGAVVMVAGAIFLCMFNQQSIKEEAILRQTTNIHTQLNTFIKTQDELPILTSIKQLLTHKLAIENITAARTHSFILVSLAYIGSGATLAYGGAHSAAAIITVGYYGLVASAALTLLALVWHSFDTNAKNRHYEAIVGQDKRSEGLAYEILKKLNHFDESFNFQPSIAERVTRFEGHRRYL